MFLMPFLLHLYFCYTYSSSPAKAVLIKHFKNGVPMKIISILLRSCKKLTRVTSSLTVVSLFLFSSVALCASVGNNILPAKIKHDQRPTVLEYSMMSKYAYEDGIEKGQGFSELPGWKVYNVYKEKNDYRSVIFKNSGTRQVVVAYRGTVPSKLRNLYEDFRGIFLNKISPYKREAFKSIKKEIEDIYKYVNEEKYDLSFTGHSLGAFLAELSVFFCHDSFNYLETSAVTFESPGSRESMTALQEGSQHKISLEDDLDIISYVGTPNVINTSNNHIGSLYQIEHDLGKGVNDSWNPLIYTLECHSIDNIVKHFERHVSGGDNYEAHYMSYWPLNTALQGQKSAYFEQAKWSKECNCYRLPDDFEKDGGKLFDLIYEAHYQIQKQLDPKHSLSLKHFSVGMQEFLYKYYPILINIIGDEGDKEKLLNALKEADIPGDVIDYLVSFSIVKVKNDYILMLPSNAPYNVYTFRNGLSEYLQKNENIKKIRDLLNSVSGSQLEIDVAIAEKGSDVKEIKNSMVKGIDAILVGIDNEGLIKAHREQQLKFIEELRKMNVKIKVRVAESGSKVGKIENVVVKGVDVGVYDKNYECDVQGNCKSKNHDL